MPLIREKSEPPPPGPDVSHLVTEDGEPVDNVFSEKQMRLLTTPLYAAWRPGRDFFAAANVGVFMVAKNPPIVPDVFVALDVKARPATGPDHLRSYFVWEYGKVPDIVVEIVSNTEGGEVSDKLRAYERIRVPNYVVFDPFHHLGTDTVMTFALHGSAYALQPSPTFPTEGLALTLWKGTFEEADEDWLRWTDLEGRLLPTHEESEARVESAKAEADAAKAEADAANAEVAALRARLRELGVDPERR